MLEKGDRLSGSMLMKEIAQAEREVWGLSVSVTGSYKGFKRIRYGSHAFKSTFGRKQAKLSPRASGSGIKKEGQEEEEEKKDCRFAYTEFLWVYLFLSQGLQLFRFALPVVFHDHHGGVDFAHRQVCGC